MVKERVRVKLLAPNCCKSIPRQTNLDAASAAQSPQLEAILAPIRIAQEQASYASMMASASSDPGPRNLDPFGDTTSRWDFTTASHPELTVKQEWDLARKELGAIFNVLASMAAVATAVYWITGSHQPAKVRVCVARTMTSRFGNGGRS